MFEKFVFGKDSTICQNSVCTQNFIFYCRSLGLDKFLQQTRDAKRYANKQKRKTTIKTVYGEVEYIRHMYYDRKTGHHVYLLDEKLQMEKIGTVSENLAQVIA